MARTATAPGVPTTPLGKAALEIELLYPNYEAGLAAIDEAEHP